MIKTILIDLIMFGLALFTISNGLIYSIDLVIKYKDNFSQSVDNQFEEDIYAPIEDYDDGFVEDLKNYEARINDMKADILKPEIVTDEQELEQERQ